MNLQKTVANVRNSYHFCSKTQLKKDLSKIARSCKGVTAKVLHAELERQLTLVQQRAVLKKVKENKTLEERLHERLLNIAEKEIKNRGLSIPAGWDDSDKIVTDYDPQRRLWVAHVEYWHEYSRRCVHKVAASYLAGYDDGQYFAVRIPQRCTTVYAALDYITPAAVRLAQQQGRWTARQGDVWLVELRTKCNNLSSLPSSHRYSPTQRALVHPQHAVLRVPAHVAGIRAYTVKTVDNVLD